MQTSCIKLQERSAHPTYRKCMAHLRWWKPWFSAVPFNDFQLKMLHPRSSDKLRCVWAVSNSGIFVSSIGHHWGSSYMVLHRLQGACLGQPWGRARTKIRWPGAALPRDGWTRLPEIVLLQLDRRWGLVYLGILNLTSLERKNWISEVSLTLPWLMCWLETVETCFKHSCQDNRTQRFYVALILTYFVNMTSHVYYRLCTCICVCICRFIFALLYYCFCMK